MDVKNKDSMPHIFKTTSDTIFFFLIIYLVHFNMIDFMRTKVTFL